MCGRLSDGRPRGSRGSRSCHDEPRGARRWLDAWTAKSIRAAEVLAPLFGARASETIGSCLSRVLAGQLDKLTGLLFDA